MENYVKETLKRIFSLGCIINTVLIVFVYLLAALGESVLVWLPDLTVYMVLVVSFVIAAAEQIFKSGMGFGKKVFLNYAVCLGTFLFIFIIGNSGGRRGAQILIASVFFTVVYFLVNSVRFVAMGKKARRINEETEYTPAFKK